MKTIYKINVLNHVHACRGPAPAGPGTPKGWVASARKKTDRHTHRRLHRRGSFFFIFRIAQNERYLPLKSPPDIGFVLLSIFFFPHVFPLCIHLEHFRLQGFFLNVPYIVFLPQWPNIFILTKQSSTNLRYSVHSLDNKTIHGKGHSNVFDISEDSTMWKPWYFSLPETTKSQFTMINY